MGCSLAYHLGQRGVAAVVLERHAIGEGSTGKCAGGVRQQFSTQVNVQVGMMSRHLLEGFEDELGVDPAFHQIGYLFLATNEEERQQFERNVAMQRSLGLDDVQLLTPSDIAQLVPSLALGDVLTGTWCPSDGLASPHEITRGYATRARVAGARIVEDVEVTAIQRQSEGSFVVTTSTGERISTPRVVNCAGAHAALIGAMLDVNIPVLPYRRHIFVTEPFEIKPSPPMTVDFATSFYFHPEGAGLLLGMSDPDEPSSFSTEVSWDFLEHLVEHATHRLPVLEKAAIQTGWAGLYEVTPDHQAIVGEVPGQPGHWLACGFSGHGFMQAPAIGRLLAQQMTGADPDISLEPFSLKRFEGASTLTAEGAVI